MYILCRATLESASVVKNGPMHLLNDVILKVRAKIFRANMLQKMRVKSQVLKFGMHPVLKFGLELGPFFTFLIFSGAFCMRCSQGSDCSVG